MDNLEKVEKLRERANVSYEEAKAALEESDWDLLDAMVKLEKSGKTAGPRQSDFRTSAETQEDYVAVKDKVMEQQNKKVHVGRTLGDVFRSFFRVCRDNAFCVNRAGEQVFRLPLIAMLVILLFTWKILIPVMIIALFFGFRYSFEGKDELKDANKFMDTAGNVVESFKEGWNNAGQKKNHAGQQYPDSRICDAQVIRQLIRRRDSFLQVPAESSISFFSHMIVLLNNLLRGCVLQCGAESRFA